MTLLIDLSINVNKVNSLTNIKKYLENLSEKYNSSLSYSNHEIEGTGSKILKHNYIFSLEFENIDNNNYINLLKDINKYKNISIDKIYDDNTNKIITF